MFLLLFKVLAFTFTFQDLLLFQFKSAPFTLWKLKEAKFYLSWWFFSHNSTLLSQLPQVCLISNYLCQYSGLKKNRCEWQSVLYVTSSTSYMFQKSCQLCWVFFPTWLSIDSSLLEIWILKKNTFQFDLSYKVFLNTWLQKLVVAYFWLYPSFPTCTWNIFPSPPHCSVQERIYILFL